MRSCPDTVLQGPTFLENSNDNNTKKIVMIAILMITVVRKQTRTSFESSWKKKGAKMTRVIRMAKAKMEINN